MRAVNNLRVIAMRFRASIDCLTKRGGTVGQSICAVTTHSTLPVTRIGSEDILRPAALPDAERLGTDSMAEKREAGQVLNLQTRKTCMMW